MFDFYLIASVITNILMFLMWEKKNVFNLSLKVLFLILSGTGGLIIINTYHLIK